MASRKNGASRPNGLMDYMDFNNVLPTPFNYRGLFPTPAAMDHSSPTNLRKAASYNETGSHAMSLNHFMAEGLLPTPIAGNNRNGCPPDSNRMKRKAEQGWTVDLHDMATGGMLPTPQASEAYKLTGHENQDSLTKRAREATGKTSQLNPLFVEEMMGFPRYWTLMPFLKARKEASAPPQPPTTTGGTRPSKPTATP